MNESMGLRRQMSLAVEFAYFWSRFSAASSADWAIPQPFLIMHTLKNYTAVTFILLWLGCGQDSPTHENPPLKLEGRWELLEAYRDNRKTETLFGTFYEFHGNRVKTNLTPTATEMEFQYVLEGKEIILNDEQGEFMKFTVENASDSLLTLRTTIRSRQFLLSLKKVPQDSLIQ